jgi:methyltransferase (TIGR00027 family)
LKDTTASMTAMAVALMRSLHTRIDPKPLIKDPWGEQLVPDWAQDAMASGIPQDTTTATSQAVRDSVMRAHPAFANVVLRARYTEDALHNAIQQGVSQYVILGAGFDSYALRVPPEGRDLQIFEIDHPATQSLKQKCIAECDRQLPDSVHFLAADLAEEKLADVLGRSAFNASQPAFFSWLGVTMYLTREANMATLAAIAHCSAPGSEVAFSYVDQEYFGPGSGRDAEVFTRLQEAVSSMDEPFLSGFHPHELAGDLAKAGLQLEEDMDDIALMQRYDPDGLNRFKSAARSHIGRARVKDIPAQQ